MKTIYILADCDTIRIEHMQFRKNKDMNFLVTVSVREMQSHSRQSQIMLDAIEATTIPYGETECDYALLAEYDAEIAAHCSLKNQELLIAPLRISEYQYLSILDVLSAVGRLKKGCI